MGGGPLVKFAPGGDHSRRPRHAGPVQPVFAPFARLGVEGRFATAAT